MKNKFDWMGHVYIIITLLLTVYGQLVLKWQMSGAGPMPQSPSGKALFLLSQLVNPWIMSGFISAFLASLAWMAAVTRFDLNYAYPFMSLAFIIVAIFSIVFLGESLNLGKVGGTLMVIAGLIVVARAN